MIRRPLSAADIHFGGPEHTFKRIGEGHYRLTIEEHGIELEVDRLWRDKDALKGELVVTCGLAGARTIDGCLSSGNFILSSTTERWHRAKHLRDRARTGDDIDFEAYLEEFCLRVGSAEREGQPAQLLSAFARPSRDETYEIDGLPLLRQHPVVVFGDGGTFKSYLGLYLAGRLAERGVAVLYADWELGGEDHRDRLERLFGPEMPEVQYLRCERPMVAEADRLRRCIAEAAVGYVICDSVAFAAGGAPESAEVAGAYFRSVRQFGVGVGSLHIAHVTKPKDEEKGGVKATHLKPFGSVFWHNAARATWYVKRADATADERRIAIGLYNHKANLGALKGPVGFEITFEDERTVVRRVDVAAVEDLAVGLPVWRRCQHLLKQGQRTIAEMADELGEKPDSIEKALKRASQHSGAFVKLTNTPDGIHRWGLAARR